MTSKLFFVAVLCMVCLSVLALAKPISLQYKSAPSPVESTSDLTYPYTKDDISMYRHVLLENIFFSQTDSIVAARSKTSPNYWYDWARDSGLTMGVLLTLFTTNGTDVGPLFERYDRNIRTQLSWDVGYENIDIRGQAHWKVDGTIVDSPWCNNQYDGAAFRVIIRVAYAQFLIQRGFTQLVRDNHYIHDGSKPGIKWELEFISHIWQNTNCCDLWEECTANHFFSYMAMRKALLLGAQLSIQMQDTAAATFYIQQAQAISDALETFVDSSNRLVRPSINYYPTSKCAGKEDMDTSVYLGALYGEFDDAVLPKMRKELLSQFETLGCAASYLYNAPVSPSTHSKTNVCQNAANALYHLDASTNLNSFKPYDPRILQSLDLVSQWSKANFQISKADASSGFLETNICRYPNDIYSGTGDGLGNAWVLTNMAAAEIMFRTANAIKQNLTSTTAAAQGCAFNDFAIATYVALLPRLSPQHAETMNSYISDFNKNLKQDVFNNDVAFCKDVQHAYTQRGIEMMTLVKFHLGLAQDLPEQIHRDTGFAQGAHYLTWSYSTLISADLMYKILTDTVDKVFI